LGWRYNLEFGVTVGPVVGHCDVAVVVVAFAHATVVAVIQAKDVPDLLALDTADVTICAGTAGSPIVGVVSGMGVFDTTPPPMMPPVIRVILDAGQAPPTRSAIVAAENADPGVRALSAEIHI
jgi:hypothetical protein